MSEIIDIKKEDAVHLNHVYNYMKRTIGVKFITSISELENRWEDAQYELSTEYQYEGVNEHVWDYYLVFCCNFSEEDLEKRLRFKIESDRFCCRKYFVFGISGQYFTQKKLIDSLFPLVNSSKPIKIIKPETIMEGLGENIKKIIEPSFFTEEIGEEGIEKLLNDIIAKQDRNDE